MCITSGERETGYITTTGLWLYFELQVNFLSEERKKIIYGRVDELCS